MKKVKSEKSAFSEKGPALAFSGMARYRGAMAYTAPTPATMKIRYRAFAAVDDATLQYWLDDAVRIVGTPSGSDWLAADAPIGLMLYAAHELTKQGIGASAIGLDIPAGVTSIKSGALSIGLSDDAAKASLSGGYASTQYGCEFLDLLKRNRGGMRTTNAGVPDYGGRRYVGGIGYVRY